MTGTQTGEGSQRKGDFCESYARQRSSCPAQQPILCSEDIRSGVSCRHARTRHRQRDSLIWLKRMRAAATGSILEDMPLQLGESLDFSGNARSG